ncbi:MAG TPA: hypothetical protein PLY87_28000 [Planctomycetaceae bacterium]|nr:hypothetical protein [Planctomycetaceae bacterium]
MKRKYGVWLRTVGNQFEDAALKSCRFRELMELRLAGLETDTVASKRRHVLQQILEALHRKKATKRGRRGDEKGSQLIV